MTIKQLMGWLATLASARVKAHKAFASDKLAALKPDLRRPLTVIPTVLALLVLGFGGTALAGSTRVNNPTPSCPDGYVFNQKTGTCDKVTVTNVTAVVGGKQVSAQSVANATVMFVAEMHIKGVKVNSRNCFWTKPGQPWQNGYNTFGGGVTYHTETTPAQLCHWHGHLVKVAGGETGRRCFNLAKLGPGPKQNVTVVIVNNFKVTIPLKAEVSVEIVENGCKASASAMASARISLSKFIKAKGKVDIKVFEQAIVNLSVAVSASVNCQPTTVTVTTPGGGTTTTVITTTPTTTHTTTTGTTSTTTTTTTTPNRPPTAELKIPAHLIAGHGQGKACLDNINDPDGDSVSVSFTYTDEQGNNLGLGASGIFDDGSAKCQMFNTPGSPMSLGILGTVSDSRGGSNGYFDRVPVVSDPSPH